MKFKFPFKIISIQVDGSSEFMRNFEQACKNSGIPLFALPPRRPKYNANVESGHCSVKYDFYRKYGAPGSIKHIRPKLTELPIYTIIFRSIST